MSKKQLKEKTELLVEEQKSDKEQTKKVVIKKPKSDKEPTKKVVAEKPKPNKEQIKKVVNYQYMIFFFILTNYLTLIIIVDFYYNGNGILSLAEIDRAVVELFPQFAKSKPVILRAYKASDISNVGFVEYNSYLYI